jgi:DNA-binding transcriptional MerR regulator
MKKHLTPEPVPGCILACMGNTEIPLRSGDLARLTRVSSDTIRHYERLGLLSARLQTAAGYRIYGRNAIERVRLVQRALQLGFSLAELSEILGKHDRGEAPCRHVLDLTEKKLQCLEQQISDLRRTRRYMRQIVRQWRSQLARTSSGTRAMLLHNLVNNPAQVPRGLSKRKQL